MTLTELRLRLQDFYGSLLVNDDAFYNRVINDSYLELAAYADWWWLEKDQVVKLSAPMVSASIVANVGVTAITFVASSGFGTAYALGWVTTTDNTYRLKSVNSTGAVLDTAFIEATGTYSVYAWNDIAGLASDVDHVVYVAPRGEPNNLPLSHVMIDDILTSGPDLSGKETEVACKYSIYRDPVYASTTIQMRFFPPPDEETEYTIHYKQAVAVMGNDTASSLIPTRHEMTLVNMALLRLCKMAREDQDMVSYFDASFQQCLGRMLSDQNRRSNVLRQVGARHSGVGVSSLPFKLSNVTVGGV